MTLKKATIKQAYVPIDHLLAALITLTFRYKIVNYSIS